MSQTIDKDNRFKSLMNVGEFNRLSYRELDMSLIESTLAKTNGIGLTRMPLFLF